MSESTNEPRSYDADPAAFGAPSDDGYVPETEPGHRPLRVGTIVWGLVLAAAGALVLTVQLTGIRLDTGMVLLGLLIGAGAALVIGGLLAVLGKNRSA
ncbi:hypothetical protein [Arthrobacter gandavensis]|uniref:hypothetical protein n=1 Tax=Arthrobacter gandavensis TaxID=169960 RepID=UPI001E513E7D|nr:hypothetical protein [Arthrobacter gandavensis]